MPNVKHAIVINAPVDKVFGFVTNPDNWTKYARSLEDIRDVSSKAVEKGTTFAWQYRMLGMHFDGKGMVTENVKNEKFGMMMEGGLPVTENFGFKKVNGGTELDVEVIYDIPGKLMQLLTENPVADKVNRKVAEGVLEKIKTYCEEL